MNPRLTIRRHGRALAVLGALVAVSATTTMALVAGTASAAPSASRTGTCIDNVNVRSEPTTDSTIVAVCEAGKAVQVAESKDGFVHLTDLDGWAAQEYVSVNRAKPASSARTASVPTTEPSATPTEDAPGDGTGGGTEPTTGPRPTPDTGGNDLGSAGDTTDSPDAGSGQDMQDGSSTDQAPVSGLLR